MPTWEVVDGNRRLIKQFSSEDEAYRWIEQQQGQIAPNETGGSGLDSFDKAEQILRVAIMGF